MTMRSARFIVVFLVLVATGCLFSAGPPSGPDGTNQSTGDTNSSDNAGTNGATNGGTNGRTNGSTNLSPTNSVANNGTNSGPATNGVMRGCPDALGFDVCEPLCTDDENCSDGEECVVQRGEGASLSTACLRADTLQAFGDPCNDPAVRCGGGLLCVGPPDDRQCRKLCAPGGTPCPEAPVCFSRPDQAAVGACLPPAYVLVKDQTDACDSDDPRPGSDLVGVALLDPNGDLKAWGRAVQWQTAEPGEVPGVFNGISPAFRTTGDCPVNTTDSVISLGCGGWVAVEFVDSETPLQIQPGDRVRVVELAGACSAESENDVHTVALCPAGSRLALDAGGTEVCSFQLADMKTGDHTVVVP